MPDSKNISILVGSDFPILRDSLNSILGDTSDFDCVGCADNSQQLLEQAQKLRPDIILLDVSMVGDKLLDLLDKISQLDISVLLINGESDDRQTIDALCCGASGVIERKTTPELLRKSVRAVVAGDIWIGRRVIAEVVQFLRDRTQQQAETEQAGTAASAPAIPDAPVVATPVETPVSAVAGAPERRFELTKREMQIVGALVEGQTNKEIATTFGISEYTVKHHLTSIFDKLGVYNRVELVLFAINHQLCPEPAQS
jgi:DNA-binding NarL/FixJ family response regulator